MENPKLEKKKVKKESLPKKPEVNRKLIFWVFAGMAIVSAGLWVTGGGGERAKVAGWGSLTVKYDLSQGRKSDDSLVINQLKQETEKLEGSYAVWVYRLERGESYGLYGDDLMPAASIMKVPVMVAVLKQAEDGKLALGDIPEGGREPIRMMLQAMGKKSDNTAAVALSKLIGEKVVEEAIAGLGMKSTSFATYITTAEDVGRMWVNLYQNKYLSTGSWQQMQEWLTDSIYEERIPRGLPEGVRVVHKVGTDTGVWVDAGIVMPQIPNLDPFVVVILNKNTKRSEAEKAVPQLVRIIWDFENNR